MGNNKITSIGQMFVVRTLKTLLLENNELEHIPPELSLLKNIQSLTIHGNPQRTVRQGILQKGTDAILAVGALCISSLYFNDIVMWEVMTCTLFS